MTIEDAIEELIEEKVSDVIDEKFSDFCDSRELDQAIEAEIERQLENGLTSDMETEVRDIADRAVERYFEYNSSGLDEDEVLGVIESALDSLPDDPKGRCSLGRSFTDAVQNVISDEGSARIIAKEVLRLLTDPKELGNLASEIYEEGR